MNTEIQNQDLQTALRAASPQEKIELIRLVEELEKRQTREKAQEDFLAFVESQWPDFISGAHHRRIAKLFEDVANGKKKRIIINLAPRHTKSKFASYLFPAWFLGKYPNKKVMEISNTAELAEGFGRDVRNLIGSEEYQSIFPGMDLRADSKAAGRWNTNKNGEYYAAGVGGALAGRGADLLIIDDPHSENEALQAKFNPGVYDKVYEWYTTGPRQRLQPGGAIIVVQTRWSLRDLTGQILEKTQQEKGVDEWECFEFPAILPSGKPLWPEYWSIEELSAIKAEIPNTKWNAQYQQNPTSDEDAIIKRDWWQTWEKDEPPDVSYIIMALDTAFEAKQTADYSACVIFGVFAKADGNGGFQNNLILLNGWRGKLEFPELKTKVKELHKEWQPDSLIIEKKASGAPLLYELRKAGIPAQAYNPSRGKAGASNDKIARLNAISDIFASGMVWAPQRRWAEEIIDEVAAFPAGRYDDYVDVVAMTLARFRAGGFVSTRHDLDDDEEEAERHARAALARKYY